jgi:flagellar biosynthesis/type III secretory pathway chaperone
VTAVRAGADALAAALTEEQELLGSLLDLAGREERAIVGGDVAELTELTDQKEQLLELLATLETERMTALTAIAGSSSLDVDALTLSAVAELVEPAEGAALTEAGIELRARALALKEANEHNAALLRSSREIVDRWIQYLRTIIAESLTYTAEGSPNESGDNRVIDRSA